MPVIAQAAAITNTAPIPLVTRGSETKSAAINWIWPGRIARAKLTLFAGTPGSGKSALAASITATVTTGGAYPCREGRAPQGAVLLVCPDADPDVLVPRLKAAGADLGRVQLLRHVEGAKGPGGLILRPTCPCSRRRHGQIKDLSLIVIDALYVPAGRSATRAMQALLDPLAAFAESLIGSAWRRSWVWASAEGRDGPPPSRRRRSARRGPRLPSRSIRPTRSDESWCR